MVPNLRGKGRVGAAIAAGVLACVFAVAGPDTGFANESDPPAFAGPVGPYTLLKTPTTAPFRPVLDGKGKAVDLTKTRGKVVLLNFWATWCGPCKEEMPSLDRLQAAFAGKPFQVVTLSVDRGNPATVAAWFREQKLTRLTLLLDAGRGNYRAFGVPGLPMSFLIDHTGKVVGYLKGQAEWDSAAAKALISFYVRQVPAKAK